MTKEIGYVRSPRPMLVTAVAAAKRGDARDAREALRDYDYAWNGIEVYVSFRSRDLYLDVEMEHQKKIEEMLDGPSPDLAKAVPMLESMLARYDQAIANSEKGPALSPLFDDVAAIRLARQGLRAAGPALKAGNLAGARAGVAEFVREWPGVEDLIQQRSADAHKEITGALGILNEAFAQGKAAGDLNAALGALIEKYTAGLNLVAAEARAAG